MNKHIKIRKETEADIPFIRSVTEAAFKTAEHSSHTEHWIIDALRRNDQLTISLIAELDNKIVGHVAISPVTIASGEKDWYGLAPISVLPEYQGQGVGALLMQKALADIKGTGAGGCVVLGDPNYYGKFGFKARSEIFYVGVPPQYFQVLSFKDQFPSGDVHYHESFSATE